MFIIKMADHDGNHRCLVEKNVPIVLILPSRWQDGAESLGIVYDRTFSFDGDVRLCLHYFCGDRKPIARKKEKDKNVSR